jgi:NAD(P)-dependent dehydrogenase (short-subunit alcohol dehydrogenase family)
MGRMQGKTVVMTGATSGIGQVAAEKLAAMGARIVQVARSQSRGEAAMASLRQLGHGVEHRIFYADLSRLSEMKRVALEIAQSQPRIDVLVNNAGALFGSRHETEDGLERTFALNHLSYFVLTLGLRERLLASAPARIVNTSSDAHRGNRLDFDDLQSARKFKGFAAYGRTKLANILFTRELARRLAGTSVTANAFHPGFVATRFGDESGGFLSYGIRFAKKLFGLTPEQGAETLIYLAASPEVEGVTGRYFCRCRPSTPTREAQDDASARRLWAESTRLAGVDVERWRAESSE